MNVSVVVPMYNQNPKYLNECLESAINQTYPKDEYEIIVVNDGSTDKDTLKALNEWKQRKIPNMVFIDKENGRTASALNAGIKTMKGEWFMWLSSDDVWFQDKIERQMNFMKKYEGKVFYSDWIRVNANGLVVRYEREPEFKTKEEMIEYLCFRFFGCGSVIMVHKSCFDKVGLFNEKLIMCEDYEMWFRLAKEYMFHKVPYRLMKYRTHAGMLSQSFNSYRMYLEVVEWGREHVGYQDLVSAIIIAHNEEKTIKSCIESVMQETPYINEIIVVDDGSTDKTAEIVKKFSEMKNPPCPITLYCLKENMGRSYARMYGIKRAKNHLVCTVDADIILDKGWLPYLLKSMVINGGMDAMAGSVRWVYDINVPWAEEISVIMTNIGKKAIGTAVTIFRKRVLEKVPFDINLRDGEDSDLFFRLERAGFSFYKDQSLIGRHVANMNLFEFMKRNYEYGQHRALLFTRYRDQMGTVDPKEFATDAKTIVIHLDNLRHYAAMLGFKEGLRRLEAQLKFPKWREHK